DRTYARPAPARGAPAQRSYERIQNFGARPPGGDRHARLRRARPARGGASGDAAGADENSPRRVYEKHGRPGAARRGSPEQSRNYPGGRRGAGEDRQGSHRAAAGGGRAHQKNPGAIKRELDRREPKGRKKTPRIN